MPYDRITPPRDAAPAAAPVVGDAPSQGTLAPVGEKRDAQASLRARDLRLMVAAMAWLAVAIAGARAGRWTAGSDTGYWLGVASGTALLLLLAYPLRKRLPGAQRWGRMRIWFALHMLLGIATPLLVILHSRLTFGSLNATVAFAVMALVATSGFVGRFLYARIHFGLYGGKATLAALRRAAADEAGQARAQGGLAPGVVERLDAFAARAERVGRQGLRRPWAIVGLGVESLVVRIACQRSARRDLMAQALSEGWDGSRIARRLARRRALVDRYVATTLRVAQFAAFERLFAWWHVLHVPLVWLLVMTVVAHVLAVHMY